MSPEEEQLRTQLADTLRANEQMVIEIKALTAENAELKEQVRDLQAWQAWARDSVKEKTQ